MHVLGLWKNIRVPEESLQTTNKGFSWWSDWNPQTQTSLLWWSSNASTTTSMISTLFPVIDGLILVVWLSCASQTVSLNRARFSDNRLYSEAMKVYKWWTRPLRHRTLIKSYCEAWAVWPPWCFKTTHDKREVDKKCACLILLLGTIIYKLNIMFAFCVCFVERMQVLNL